MVALSPRAKDFPDAKGIETIHRGTWTAGSSTRAKDFPDAKGIETLPLELAQHHEHQVRKTSPMRRGLRLEGHFQGYVPLFLRAKDFPDAKGIETKRHKWIPGSQHWVRKTSPVRRGLRLRLRALRALVMCVRKTSPTQRG